MKQTTRNIKKTTKQTIKPSRNQKEMKKAAKKNTHTTRNIKHQ